MKWNKDILNNILTPGGCAWGLVAATLFLGLPSCKDELEGSGTGNGSAELSLFAEMPSGFIQSRANEPSFCPGTLYNLFGASLDENGEISWSTNYLHKDYEENKAGLVYVWGYTDYDGENNQLLSYTTNTSLANRFNANPIYFYGITVASEYDYLKAGENEKVTDDVAENNKLIYHPASENYPTYATSVNEKGVILYNITRRSNEVKKDTLPDVMWAKLENQTPANSGKIVLPFTHTLSKLNFYAVKAKGVKDITIKSLTLKDYEKGTLSMADGLYTYEDTERNTSVDVYKGTPNKDETSDITYYEVPENNVLVPVGDFFSKAFVFPTKDALYQRDANITENNPIKLSVTIQVADETEEKTLPEVDLKSAMEVGTGLKNSVFNPNHEYDIVLTFTDKNVIVTVIPRYYEYIPEDRPLGEYEVGEPIDFGGVLWAAQNLGATSANASANAIEWEKSRGFYYQFARSIPYFVRGDHHDPDPTSDSNWDRGGIGFTVPNCENDDINGNNCARPYPYIPYLWEKNNITPDNFRTIYSPKNYDNNANDYQTCAYEPNHALKDLESNNDFRFISINDDRYPDWYATNLSNDTEQNDKKGFADYWKDKTNQPCPKGWRLPTQAEFMSIFPGSARAGDISFRNYFTEENNKVPMFKTGSDG